MLIIRNAKIISMAQYDSDCADIRIDGGKIAAIGENLDVPAGAQTIDAKGLWALPGFVDAHCHIGMWEEGMGDEGADGNEDTDPVTPHLRALDAINPEDQAFSEALESGVTTAVTGPGSANVLGGQFLALKMAGSDLAAMVLREPVALKAALGENPKVSYGKAKKTPATRMATAAIFRESLLRARDYQKKRLRGVEDPDKRPDYDMKMEALLEALEGRLPVKIHAHRADDIFTAIRIAEEFSLRYTIEHCTEGYRVIDRLKEKNVQAILGPLISGRSKIELKNLTMRAPLQFYRASMPFAIMTDHPVIPIQYRPVCAARAAREGLPEHEALRAITINAARACNIDDRVGSLKPGMDADVSLFDGNPLEFRTKAQYVLVDGRIAFAR